MSGLRNAGKYLVACESNIVNLNDLEQEVSLSLEGIFDKEVVFKEAGVKLGEKSIDILHIVWISKNRKLI